MSTAARISFLLFTILSSMFSFQIDPSLLQSLKWRMIGPHRGGRTVGATGVPGQSNVFYIGVNNGGVWRTSDYGRTWKPLFDEQPTGSIGALAVAPSNPKVIYVGTGEGLQRPDLSVGDGMYKSTDEGKTWTFLGLGDAQQIGAVAVDPTNENKVYAAILGHPYGANSERGVFRSSDGGTSWKKILYKDENTGAIALAIHPKNPDFLIADLWSARQGPWENGSWQGKNSGLYKTIDGGNNWTALTKGLPGADQGVGRIGFSFSNSDSSIVYATVDALSGGGIYRSTDAGETWNLVNNDRRLWARGSDFAEIDIDPKNSNIIYTTAVAAYKSTDAGKSWMNFKGAPGGDDYHTLWINPDNPNILLYAADQGAVISVNGGASWSSWYNQPTAQFYHVSTDNQFPYNVYGGQQESGSAMVSSRGDEGQITFRDWHSVHADEYAYVAPDPLNPNIVYGGRVTKFDRRTGQVQNIAPEVIRSGKYRTLRTAPLVFSPADKRSLFFAANVLWKTTNGGNSWEIISPDLSRETCEVPNNIGIFKTDDMKTMTRRGVIYSVGPSYTDANVLWAGTDDGLVHVTMNGGINWSNVTPPELTAWSKISQIDAGHFDVHTAYISVNRFRLDDLSPHIYRTHNNGTTWKEIVTGLDGSGPVNAVREDPVRKGMLYAATEKAVYVSFDDGDHWQSLRLNMPATSIRDLVIHDGDIVVGTHGRSFWILDDITPLRQINSGIAATNSFLFKPQEAYRVRWNMNTDTPLPPDEPAGENPPDGAIIDYFLKNDAKLVTLEIFDNVHRLVRRYASNDVLKEIPESTVFYPTYWIRPLQKLSAQKGMQRFVWDLHYSPPQGFEPWFPIAATFQNTARLPLGPWVHPGKYSVTLTVDGVSSSQTITVKMDPRVSTPGKDLQQQFDLSMNCYRPLMQSYDISLQIQAIRKNIQALTDKNPSGPLLDALKDLEKKMTALSGITGPGESDVVYSSVSTVTAGEETFSGMMNTFNYLMILLQGSDVQPTIKQREAVKDQDRLFALLLKRWDTIRMNDLKAVNVLLQKNGMNVIE